MKKITFIIVLLFITYGIKAQTQSAKEILKQYGFTAENILSCIDLSNANYSFKALQITKTEQEANHSTTKKEKEYSYDSSKPLGSRFTLISVDGDRPRKKDFKHFDKEKNSTEQSADIKLSDDDFFVKSNDDKTAIIGFNIPMEQLNSKTAFMAHCTGFIYIDRNSGRITKIQIKSNEAFNLKIFHVISMILDINIAYNKDKKIYYVTSENTKMKVLIIGNITDFEINEQYSDFKFN